MSIKDVHVIKEVSTEGILFDDVFEQRQWEQSPKMLIICKLLESAQQELDSDTALEIRRTADELAVQVLKKYRG